MQEFVGLFVFLVLAISFALVIFAVGSIFASKKTKSTEQQRSMLLQELFACFDMRFEMRFVVYAVMFLIICIQVGLLFAGAVIAAKLGTFAFVEVGVFASILFWGLVYALRKNVLRWK